MVHMERDTTTKLRGLNMFNDLQRELNRLEQGLTLSIPVEPDEEGYFDKKCPAENCLFQFKVNAEDWVNLFLDEAVYCPMCRHEAPADSWWTTEQIEYAREQAVEHVRGLIGDSLHKMARRFNASQPKNGFIRMSMEVSGTRGYRAVVPIPSSETLELQIQCEECSARFAVIGSAFFCPCCGTNSVLRTFDDAMRKVLVKLESVSLLRSQFASMGKRDESEILARSLVETALSDCVVAFQRLSEKLYETLPNAVATRSNVFQRIPDGSKLWSDAVGSGYEDWLSGEELATLNILFQRRHLLAHTEGIVDQKYIDRSEDSTYQLGQRIVVSESDVRQLVHLITKLADQMRTSANG